MGVNTTTIAYLRVLIIEIGSTIILMVVEAQGIVRCELLVSGRATVWLYFDYFGLFLQEESEQKKPRLIAVK